jgi:hypothetical protein
LEASLKATGERRQELLSDSHSSASAPTIPVEAPELSVEIRNISDKCVVPASNDAQSFRGFCNFWRWFDMGPGNNLEAKGYLRGRFDAYKHMQTEKNKKPCGSSASASSHAGLD